MKCQERAFAHAVVPKNSPVFPCEATEGAYVTVRAVAVIAAAVLMDRQLAVLR